MSSDVGMEPLTEDTEWSASFGSESELLRINRGKRRHSKRLKSALFGTIAVLAILLIIGLIVGLVIKQRSGSNTQISVSEWLTTSCANTDTTAKCPWNGGNPLLLISLSGFRADYLQKDTSPVIDKLRHCGVQTPYLRPVYPTKSYPNQYTIATGLYPESHGIVNDEMYDSKIKTLFKGTESNQDWWGGEPLWVTAKKQGKKSASCKWAGSGVNSNDRPELLCKGNENEEEMVDTIVKWLRMKEGERPDFISVSFEEPRKTGRTAGPNSVELYLKIKSMDGMIGKLMTSLHSYNLDNCVNIVIVSDHGMSDTGCLRQVYLDYLLEDLPESLSLLKFDGTSGSIYTNYKQQGSQVSENDNGVSTDDILDTLACRSHHLKLYTAETMPLRHHYSYNSRIGDVVLDVEDSWLVSDRQDDSSACPKAGYGYDSTYKSMHAIFLAHGPDIQHNVTTEPFESIELYNFMAELLKVKPAPNNGTNGALNHILRDDIKIADDGVTVSSCSYGKNNRESSCPCSFQDPGDGFPETPNRNTLPFGTPVKEQTSTPCLLYGEQFSVIYSSDYKQPLLSSYELTSYQAQNYKSAQSKCSRPDQRLTDSVNPDCKEYSNDEKRIDAVHLFDPGFSTTEDDIAESYLSSTMVPMYSEFQKDTWALLWSLVKEYAITFKNIHITVGPIFDRNHDGKADLPSDKSFIYVANSSTVPIPTHFYMIVTRCSRHEIEIMDCSIDDLEILSFVFPHITRKNNCMLKPSPNNSWFIRSEGPSLLKTLWEKENMLGDKDYLKDNMVRIRDIELLTGLRLLTKFESNAGARKRTFLPSNIWPSPLFAHWIDLPCDEENACVSDYTPLLLISFDGFRSDYLTRNLTPAIEKLRSCGVRTPYMTSVFPTETYPNHYTIITGLYPESHGIVENYMYDREMNLTFDEKTELNPDWWKGEPLWITNQKHGKKSASTFWFGADIHDPAKKPSYTMQFDEGESDRYQDMIEQIVTWMSMKDEERPDFITMYVDQPDIQGHEFGPNSPQLNDMLKYVDSLVQTLMDELMRNNLHNCVNIVIVSDHGMTPESCRNQVALKDYYPEIEDVVAFLGTTGIINTNFKKKNSVIVPNKDAGTKEKLFQALECKSKHFDAFVKETLPVRYHYTNNDRIGDIVLDASDTWMIRPEKKSRCGKGNHGYDPAYKNMRALFLAHGPSFKQNFEVEPFENIELYNIMSDVLHIEPAPNNGTVGALDYMLRKTPQNEDHTPLLDIHPCNGTFDRTSSCSCGGSVSGIPSGNHTYHGGLALEEKNLSICFLTNSLFATVYSKDNKQPTMISFLATPKQVKMVAGSCVVPDTKLSDVDNPDCTAYENTDSNINWIHLFHPDFISTALEASEAELSSNLVPMYNGFFNNVWGPAMATITEYVNKYTAVHVSLGPVFDRDYNGRVDIPGAVTQDYVKDNSSVPVPTHFFIILLKCRNSTVLPVDCDTREIDILSFILPHVNKIPNCKSVNFFLKKNIVRLRDIELLTGLRYLTETEWMIGARKRTHLPAELWSFD